MARKQNDWQPVKESGSVLNRLVKERVFEIKQYGESFEIVECCDNYYSISVTREELRSLGQDILELASNGEEIRA